MERQVFKFLRRASSPGVGAGSFLLVTLDSCRYDAFAAAAAPHIKGLGEAYRAYSHSTYTYGAHQCMFTGFLPSVHEQQKYLNSKYAKVFKLNRGGFSPGEHLYTLQGRNVIDGLRRKGYYTLGTGATGWFDPGSAPGRVLTEDFNEFFYPGN